MATAPNNSFSKKEVIDRAKRINKTKQKGLKKLLKSKLFWLLTGGTIVGGSILWVQSCNEGASAESKSKNTFKIPENAVQVKTTEDMEADVEKAQEALVIDEDSLFNALMAEMDGQIAENKEVTAENKEVTAENKEVTAEMKDRIEQVKLDIVALNKDVKGDVEKMIAILSDLKKDGFDIRSDKELMASVEEMNIDLASID